MKIRPSLKLYFILAMLLTSIVTITAMSIVSVKFYFAGLDVSNIRSMYSNAYKVNATNGKAIKINYVTVSSRWQDQPAVIKAHFDKHPFVEGALLKYIDGYPLFGATNAGYLVKTLNKNNQPRYISSMFVSQPPYINNAVYPSNFLCIFIIATIAIVLLSLVPFFILRNVATPIEKLIIWAKQLDSNKLLHQRPKFHYQELDSLAEIIQASLRSVQKSLEREMRFLGYVSHELRTPISVTRTNTELLRKMLIKGVSKKKQLIVLDRIERASLTMTDLTETLLWLNIEQGKSIPIKQVKMGELIKQLVSDLDYLLIGKQVAVSTHYDDSILKLPEALCIIIISNLIRNAFQHTHEGNVNIKQSNSHLSIINENKADFDGQEKLGFGLGLELTKILVKHLGWEYKNIQTNYGHHVEIEFK